MQHNSRGGSFSRLVLVQHFDFELDVETRKQRFEMKKLNNRRDSMITGLNISECRDKYRYTKGTKICQHNYRELNLISQSKNSDG